MGCSISKSEKHVREPKSNDAYYAEDERFLYLLKHCIDNDSDGLKLALEGNIRLDEEYHGAPVIFSATLALINDPDYERFQKNWDQLVNKFSNKVFTVDEMSIFLTHFTKNKYMPRTNGLIVFHINDLNKDIIDGVPKYSKKQYIGKLTKGNIKDFLTFILNRLHLNLEQVTKTKDYQDYTGSHTEKMETVIRKNARYALNHTNNIEKLWIKPPPPPSAPPAFDIKYN